VIINWQPVAIANRDAQLDYIALDNPKAAIEQGDKIANHIIKLIDFPDLGRAGRIKMTRELVISGTPFIAIYRVSGNKINILALLHGSQQWPKKLK